MTHKLLYVVAVLYQKAPTETAVFAPKCYLSLQLGYSPDECIENAKQQAADQHAAFEKYMPRVGGGWTWAGAFANPVTPEEIERLNREAGTVAVMLWPDELEERDE